MRCNFPNVTSGVKNIMVEEFIKEFKGQKVCANCKFYSSYYVLSGLKFSRLIIGMCGNKDRPDPHNDANSRFVMTGCDYFSPNE